MYLHVCDDGTLMFDEEIRQYGVGQYNAAWERIQAEWYMAINAPDLKKIELKRAGKHAGFAISQDAGTHTAHYPHVYGLEKNTRMTLCVQGEEGAAIEILMDGKTAGSLRLDQAILDLSEMTIPLSNDAGEQDITLRLTGQVTIDWFRFE